MTFVGFDLHKRYITACALDASGAPIAEIRQLATTIETVLDWLDALPTPVVVAHASSSRHGSDAVLGVARRAPAGSGAHGPRRRRVPR